MMPEKRVVHDKNKLKVSLATDSRSSVKLSKGSPSLNDDQSEESSSSEEHEHAHPNIMNSA